MEAIIQAVTGGLGSVQSDTVTMMAAVIGVGVVIFGIKFATSQGFSFFKKVTK